MKNLILNNIAVILLFICFTALIGCSTSQNISKNDDGVNDSLLLQRKPGLEVFILMNDGGEFTGELLRVRDSTIILSKEYGATEEDLLQLVYPFYLFQNSDIKMVELKGDNNLIMGIVLGGVFGAAIGGGIGVQKGQKLASEGNWRGLEAAVSGCCIGGIMGALIGAILGGATSTGDDVVYEYVDPEDFDFTQLNIYSRYGGEEPEYLKEIN